MIIKTNINNSGIKGPDISDEKKIIKKILLKFNFCSKKLLFIIQFKIFMIIRIWIQYMKIKKINFFDLFLENFAKKDI